MMVPIMEYVSEVLNNVQFEKRASEYSKLMSANELNFQIMKTHTSVVCDEHDLNLFYYDTCAKIHYNGNRS